MNHKLHLLSASVLLALATSACSVSPAAITPEIAKTTSVTTQTPAANDSTRRINPELEAQIISWRRDIHQNPELSNREFRTAALVQEHLESFGMKVHTGIAHTGVVGILEGGQPDRKSVV